MLVESLATSAPDLLFMISSFQNSTETEFFSRRPGLRLRPKTVTRYVVFPYQERVQEFLKVCVCGLGQHVVAIVSAKPTRRRRRRFWETVSEGGKPPLAGKVWGPCLRKLLNFRWFFLQSGHSSP